MDLIGYKPLERKHWLRKLITSVPLLIVVFMLFLARIIVSPIYKIVGNKKRLLMATHIPPCNSVYLWMIHISAMPLNGTHLLYKATKH